MPTETFESLRDRGGQILGYGDVVRDTDYQIIGHRHNEAICPPEKRWIGWTTIPTPHPMFIRMNPSLLLAELNRYAREVKP